MCRMRMIRPWHFQSGNKMQTAAYADYKSICGGFIMDCKDKILSEDYRDLILDYFLREDAEVPLDLCTVDVGELYRLLYINQDHLAPIIDTPYEYLYTPRLYGLMPISGGSGNASFDPLSLTASGITQIQRQPLNLTGRGVILVLIGSGIDYTLDVFRDQAGNTRLLSIWDQTIQDGTPPEGFLFGTEYDREMIDRALASEDPFTVVPSRDENRHGSTMLSVAAGSRSYAGNAYTGAAPDAVLAVVKLKQCKQYLRDYYLLPQNVEAYEEQDIMLGLQYADSLSDRLDRPIVICMGLGTNMGAHSGDSALDQYLARLAVKKSRAIVIAGGDEGNAAHHYSGALRRGRDAQGLAEAENYEDVEVRVGENCRGFVMEFWGSVPDIYNIEIRTPGGETVPPLRLSVGQSVTYSFIYERSKVTVSNVLVEPVTGEELLIFRIQDPTAGIWNFRVTVTGRVNNGTFHMWLPITQFLTSEVYFTEPDPYTTLTEPAMSDNVIAVSTYNDVNNSFFIESGRGFSRTGQIRPDFAAPGVNVSTVYGKQTGSSLAAAISAGAVAQFFQWAVVEGNNEYLDTQEIKNYFIRGASREPGTVYPNREMGYGRLDLAGTFDILAGL